MIQREYDVDKARDVSHEILAYETSLLLALENAQYRVEAIKTLLQRAKERRLDLEVQSIN